MRFAELWKCKVVAAGQAKQPINAADVWKVYQARRVNGASSGRGHLWPAFAVHSLSAEFFERKLATNSFPSAS